VFNAVLVLGPEAGVKAEALTANNVNAAAEYFMVVV